MKTLIIGIDGAPPEIIFSLIKKGKLKNLQRVLDNGSWGKLESTTPPLSPLAWPSFTTGTNPGKTSIYDFLRKIPGSHDFEPIDNSNVCGETFWDILGESNKETCVFNVPITYPPKPLNGHLVSGWLSPHHRRDFTFPKSLLNELEDKIDDFDLYPHKFYTKGKEGEFFKELDRVLDVETRAAIHLMKAKKWDVFFSVFLGTDILQHYTMHLIDPDHPAYSKPESKKYERHFWKYYQKVDKSVGKLIACSGKDTNVIVMSDHGAAPYHRAIYLNTWLLRKGYLTLKNSGYSKFKKALFDLGLTLSSVHGVMDKLHVVEVLESKLSNNPSLLSHPLIKKLFLSFDDVDWRNTTAFSVGRLYGSIFINTKDGFPDGAVTEKKLEATIQRLVTDLSKWKDENGKNLVGKILYKNDIYHGPHIDSAPDLLVLPKNPKDLFFGFSDFGSNKITFSNKSLRRIRGHHTQDGILLMAGPDIRKSKLQKTSIMDVAPTILALNQITPPIGMDGSIISNALKRNNGLLEDKLEMSRRIIAATYDKNSGVFFKGGKETSVMLWLMRDMYKNLNNPMIFLDSGSEFPETYQFINSLVKKWGLNLKTFKYKATTAKSSQQNKIKAINKAINTLSIEKVFVAIRRDENPARANEKSLSPREDHIRIHPMLDFTEGEIWQIIKHNNIPYSKIYEKGYRSFGISKFTKKSTGSERSGREKDKEEIMHKLRNAGYF